MRGRYGGGGSFFDGKHNIHSDKRLEKTSLRYFITCSEERLERIKRGEGLVPTATKQMTEFRKNSVSPAPQQISEEQANPFLTAEDVPAGEEKLEFCVEKWSKQKLSKGDSSANLKPELKDYLSKGMYQYMSQRTFAPTMEKRKLENLDQFFKEKYFMISDLLGGPSQTAGADDLSVARHAIKTEKTRAHHSVHRERRSVVQKKPAVSSLRKIEQWRAKLDSMDEEIDKIVEKNLQSQRQEFEDVMRQEAKARAFLHGPQMRRDIQMGRSKSQAMSQNAPSSRFAQQKTTCTEKNFSMQRSGQLPPLLTRHSDI